MYDHVKLKIGGLSLASLIFVTANADTPFYHKIYFYKFTLNKRGYYAP